MKNPFPLVFLLVFAVSVRASGLRYERKGVNPEAWGKGRDVGEIRKFVEVQVITTPEPAECHYFGVSTTLERCPV
jgi:hypothetical protein